MNKSQNSIIVFSVGKSLTPFIMMFGLYVTFHGHYSPGGGFQGGTLLAASIILIRLIAGSKNATKYHFPRHFGILLGAIGAFIYFLVGCISLFYKGNFLNYSELPLPFTSPYKHYYGILFIEVGVTLAVAGVLVFIYDTLRLGVQDE